MIGQGKTDMQNDETTHNDTPAELAARLADVQELKAKALDEQAAIEAKLAEAFAADDKAIKRLHDRLQINQTRQKALALQEAALQQRQGHAVAQERQGALIQAYREAAGKLREARLREMELGKAAEQARLAHEAARREADGLSRAAGSAYVRLVTERVPQDVINQLATEYQVLPNLANLPGSDGSNGTDSNPGLAPLHAAQTAAPAIVPEPAEPGEPASPDAGITVIGGRSKRNSVSLEEAELMRGLQDAWLLH